MCMTASLEEARKEYIYIYKLWFVHGAVIFLKAQAVVQTRSLSTIRWL